MVKQTLGDDANEVVDKEEEITDEEPPEYGDEKEKDAIKGFSKPVLRREEHYTTWSIMMIPN